MTPCQYRSQLNVYLELNRRTKGAKPGAAFKPASGFIDSIPGW